MARFRLTGASGTQIMDVPVLAPCSPVLVPVLVLGR